MITGRIAILRPLSAFLFVWFIFTSSKGRSQQPAIPLSEQPSEEIFYAALNDSIKANPQNPVYRYMRANGYQEKNKHAEAIVDLNILIDILKNHQKIITLHEDTIDIPSLLWGRAYSYRMTDSTERSIADYRELQKYKPNDFFVQVAVPFVYIKHKKFDEAQKEIDSMKKNYPANERGWVYDAILRYEKGDYKSAELSVNNCLQKFPGSIEGILTKSKILIKLSRTDDACATLEEAKKKMSIGYFGGGWGYHHSFEDEIKSLQKDNCK